MTKKFKSLSFIIFALFLSLSSISSCDNTYQNTTSVVQYVLDIQNGEEVQLKVNDTLQLNITSQNLTETIIYTSSDPSVASVSNTGLITALSEGESFITASANNTSDTIKVVVSKNTTILNPSIEILDGDELSLEIDQTYKLNIKTENITEDLIFSSQNEFIAKVNNSGLITAISKGETLIEVKANNVNDQIKVIVKEKTITPTPILEILTPNNSELEVGSNLQLNLKTENLTEDVIYSSSNNEVATISNSGLISAISKGSVTISVSANGISDSINIIVKEKEVPPSLVILNGEEITLNLGDTLQLNVSLENIEGSILYESSNSSVASVNQNGLISAIKEGEAIIIASINEVKDSIKVTVIPTADGSVQYYEHVFNKNDFNGGSTSAGSFSSNGLTWDYDAFNYLGQDYEGIQIGSNNSPHKTPWNIVTQFNGKVTVLSYELIIKTNSPARYDVTMDSYTHGENLPKENIAKLWGENDISVDTTSFKLSLSNQTKAVYLYSISLKVFVPNDVDLELKIPDINLVAAKPGQGVVPNANYTLTSKEDYYKDIDFEADSTILKNELHSLISNMTKISYGTVSNTIIYTDESIKKPGVLYGMFDGDELSASYNGTWNKEHVWPCSLMKENGKDPRPSDSTKNHATDLFNLRACCQTTNLLHGNKFYDNSDSSNTFFPNVANNGSVVHKFEGDHRGDVARILFYMALRYDFLSIVEDINNATDTQIGKLSVLLDWNELDPVDDFEIQRNNRIYEFQGNRNPFIDYPELVDKLYSN